MALRKVLGVETEYGILVRGAPDANPIAASSVLINAYVSELAASGGGSSARAKVGLGLRGRAPRQRRPGLLPAGAAAPEVETHLVNTVLTNGARYYVDHAHPELSTPECADPRSIVVWDRAAELILQRSMAAANRTLPAGQELVVYKNNSDGKGNSYGCHENYLMDRKVPFGRIVAHAIPFFVTRQIFTGAGKVGTEAARRRPRRRCGFQLGQRADFFEEEVGLETTLKRPIVNTRDEPHADAQKYRRLHVIVGDANLSEVATFLKVGTTALVLCMVEDDFLPREWQLAAAVPAMRHVSRDLTLRQPLQLADGTTATALEIQWEYFDRARKYADAHGLDVIGGADGGGGPPAPLGGGAPGLETDPDVAGRPARLGGQATACSTATANATASAGTTPAWRRWTCSTTTSDPRRALAGRVGLERITTDEEVASAATTPPPTPGRGSAASASAASPTPSWRPTGTRWSSTSAATRCAGCR